MKLENKHSTTILYNPFLYIAGAKSFVFGFVVLLLTTFLSFSSGTHYNGLANIYFAKDTAFIFYFSEQVFHWLTLSILFFGFSLLLSKSKVRFIDIIGTQAMARIPLIILPIHRVLPLFDSFMINSFKMYFLIAVHIICVTWSIALMYNAYKVTCNVKQQGLVISFIIAIFIAEILTKLFIYLLQNNLYL